MPKRIHESDNAAQLNEESDLSSVEEDEGEQLDDDEELEEKEKIMVKRKKKSGVNNFFLDEAEVDDDEEEDEASEEGGDLLDAHQEAEEAEQHRKTAFEYDARQRYEELVNAEDEEAVEEHFRKRYMDTNLNVSSKHYGVGEAMVDDITQQQLLPDVKDPNLWLVKCRRGEEKNTVFQLMKKFLAFQYQDQPLQIKSVIAKEGLSGYIYIEAYKHTHVKAALEGVGALQIGKWSQTMVNLNEMTSVLKVVKDSKRIKPKQWVRVRSGLYKDDLAQVQYVEDAQNIVCLKLVPRIDYTQRLGVLKQMVSSEEKQRKPFRRPPQAMFNQTKIREIGGESQRDGQFYVFRGCQYDAKGFLLKKFNFKGILIDGIKPTLAELEKFEESPESVNVLQSLSKSQGDIEHNFSAGDIVEVVHGDLQHLRGKILRIEGNQIVVQPSHDDLKDPISFSSAELRKWFKAGNHVKVLAGTHERETGMVLVFEPSVAVIISDSDSTQFRVHPKDLRLTQERSIGVDSSGRFQLGDLINVDPQTVGVVVRFEKDRLQVLNTHDKLMLLRNSVNFRRRDSRRGVTFDQEGKPLVKKDTVNVVEGPYTTQQGEILHVYREWVFLSNKTRTENFGIFVCRGRHCLRKGGSTSDFVLSQPRPINRDILQSPSLNQQEDGAPSRLDGMAPTFKKPTSQYGRNSAHKDRKFIGMAARICKGPLKGHVGIIKDISTDKAKIELHDMFKTVQVSKENFVLIDKAGRIVDSQFGVSQQPSQRPTSGWGGRTPSYGAQTPMYGASTPFYGSETPRIDGCRTPHVGMSGSVRGEGDTPRAVLFDPAAGTPAHHNSSHTVNDDDEMFEMTNP